jgi:hypothetical protein
MAVLTRLDSLSSAAQSRCSDLVRIRRYGCLRFAGTSGLGGAFFVQSGTVFTDVLIHDEE